MLAVGPFKIIHLTSREEGFKKKKNVSNRPILIFCEAWTLKMSDIFVSDTYQICNTCPIRIEHFATVKDFRNPKCCV